MYNMANYDCYQYILYFDIQKYISKVNENGIEFFKCDKIIQSCEILRSPKVFKLYKCNVGEMFSIKSCPCLVMLGANSANIKICSSKMATWGHINFEQVQQLVFWWPQKVAHNHILIQSLVWSLKTQNKIIWKHICTAAH